MDGLKARLSFDAVAYDYDDEYLTIDTDTHTININNVSRLFGVQYDGNSKLIKFRIRNKLSDIQKMQDSIVYINWIDSRGVKGQSIAINKTINNDTCEFAWKVPFDALKISGVLHFAVSAVVTKNSSSVIDQRWSTKIASVITPDGIYIKSYTPSSEEEDRIAQIYTELSNMINKQNDNLQSQVNSLKEDLYIIREHTINIFEGDLNQGDISINNGNDITDALEYYVRTLSYIPIDSNIKVVDNTCFINISTYSKINNIKIYFYDVTKNFIKAISKYSGNEGELTNKTAFNDVPENAMFIRLVFAGSSGTTKYNITDVKRIQIQYGKVMTTYTKPYTANDTKARKEVINLKKDKFDIIENVFNPDDENVEIGTIYVNGAPVTGQGNEWCTTGYIPCNKGDSFSRINKAGWNTWITYYTEDKQTFSYTGELNANYYTIPDFDEIKFVRFALKTTDRNLTAIYNTSNKISLFYPYKTPILNASDVIFDNYSFKQLIANKDNNQLWKYSCGNILCLGDSLTDGLYADTSKGLIQENYPYYLSRMINAEVNNVGKNGSYPTECYKVTLPKQDISKYDTAIIWLGTNGGLFNTGIDVEGTEANYYCKIIEYLLSKKQDIVIFICKVFITGELHSGVTVANVTETNKTIDTIANKYNLSVIDLSDLGFANHPELHANIDNTHFGKAGNIFIANRIANFMQTYFTNNVDKVEFGLLTKQSHLA